MIERITQLEALLAADAEGDLADLHRRDRATGHSSRHLASQPAAQVLAWAAARRAETGLDEIGASGPERGVGVAVVLLAFTLGCAAAAGTLYYPGAGRVNVLAVLAVLVGLQAVALLATALLMLPSSWRTAAPGLGAVQDLVALLSPGRLLDLLAARLPPAARERLAPVLDASATRHRRYARLRRWLVLYLAQVFGVALNAGVVAAYLCIVVFTDLAFGWSTTLDVAPASVVRLVDTLAVPWQAWLPGAAPAPELVEASRYFRAERAPVADAGALGRWWTFVLMCILVYAALPRVLLLAVAAARLRAAANWTVLHLPGVSELIYRLNNEVVDTRAEALALDASPDSAPVDSASAPPARGPGFGIAWGGAPLPEQGLARPVLLATGLDVPEPVRAGGAASLETDASALRAASASDRPVAIVVKAWEPPLGDLLDALTDLRGAMGEGRAIFVVPVAEMTEASPPAADVAVWRERVGSLRDPWLHVRAIDPPS